MEKIIENGDDKSTVDTIAMDPVGSRMNRVRNFVGRLGIPGLLIYNGIRSGIVGVTVASIFEGSAGEKAFVGATAGGLNLITSQTFWLVVGMVGAKVGGSFLNKRHA